MRASRPCGNQYERPGGRESGDRIVRCDRPEHHDGAHRETETDSEWGYPYVSGTTPVQVQSWPHA